MSRRQYHRSCETWQVETTQDETSHSLLSRVLRPGSNQDPPPPCLCHPCADLPSLGNVQIIATGGGGLFFFCAWPSGKQQQQRAHRSWNHIQMDGLTMAREKEMFRRYRFRDCSETGTKKRQQKIFSTTAIMYTIEAVRCPDRRSRRVCVL
jgi:hypothetical protein